MKIMMFIPSLLPGGAERVMSTVANYMVKEDDVEILMLNEMEPFYDLSEKIVVKNVTTAKRFEGIIGSIIFLFAEFRRRKDFIHEVETYQPDIILSFLNTTNLIVLSAKYRVKTIPIVVSERNDPNLYNKILRTVISNIYPKADLIICQGSKVASYYKSKRGKTVVIPNPINISSIGDYHEQREKKIVSVGRLIEVKNHKLLINAFKKISEEYPDYILEIYGEGELRNELERLIETLDIADRVFLRGNKKNVMQYIDTAQCFVLTSNYEGFPNVLLEAMASGLPVISTDFPTGIAYDLIENGINGYVVPVGDEDKLVDAIRNVLKSKELQSKMGKSNLYVRELYSEEIICRKWKDTLHEIACRRKKYW
mgnify:CR=1 FL=1